MIQSEKARLFGNSLSHSLFSRLSSQCGTLRWLAATEDTFDLDVGDQVSWLSRFAKSPHVYSLSNVSDVFVTVGKKMIDPGRRIKAHSVLQVLYGFVETLMKIVEETKLEIDIINVLIIAKTFEKKKFGFFVAKLILHKPRSAAVSIGIVRVQLCDQP